MLAAIIALAPLVLEILKLFVTSKASGADKKAAVDEATQALKNTIARLRAAIDKAEETEGDTSAIEDEINKRPQQ